MSSTAALDIRRFIDDRPVSRYQMLVALMCGLIVFVDGFDAQAMGFVAPALTAAMGISRGGLSRHYGAPPALVPAAQCEPALAPSPAILAAADSALQ